MAENEPGGSSRAPRKMNTWFYFPPMAIHYSLSEGIHFYIQNFLPPTPWIPQTIHFGRLFILRVIHFERDHCMLPDVESSSLSLGALLMRRTCASSFDFVLTPDSRRIWAGVFLWDMRYFGCDSSYEST